MSKRLTDAEILAQIPTARAAGQRSMRAPWWPIAARYDAEQDTIAIRLRSGITLGIPRSAIKELEAATRSQLGLVEIIGEALRWAALDVDISVSGLLGDLLGSDFITTQAGRLRGSKRTEAKAAAARANGAKGGRPRKQKST